MAVGNQPIRGRVAKILDSRHLVLNRGSEQGVTPGMRFAVLDPNAENIKDPETLEVIGSLERTKIEVEVYSVEEGIALARTFKRKRRNVGGTGLALAGLSRALEPPKYVESVETLKTNESTWEDLDESESLVKTGDPVKQIAHASEEAQ